MDSLLYLNRGSVGNQVKYLQRILNSKKHFDSPDLLTVDGIFGPLTEKALIDFQDEKGIVPANGVVDQATFDTLVPMTEFRPPKELQYCIYTMGVGLENDPFVVAIMQTQLKVLYPSFYKEVDGIFDGHTQFFLTLFQKANHINPPHGKLDSETNKALHLAVARKNGRPLFTKRHKISFITQSTKMSCWAACSAMMKHESEAVAIARLPAHLGNKDKGLYTANYYAPTASVAGRFIAAASFERNHDPSKDKIFNTSVFNPDDYVSKDPGDVEREFAEIFKFDYHNYHPNIHWMVHEILRFLKKSPIMFSTTHKNYVDFDESVTFQWITKDSGGHFRVIAGVISDGNSNGTNTYFVIYDPYRFGDAEEYPGDMYMLSYDKLFGPNPQLPMSGFYVNR